MAIVQFNQVDEFCEELEKEKDNIDRRIVRVTNLFTQSKFSPNVHHVKVVATFSVKEQLVCLERYCGELWGVGGESDHKVMQEASEAQELLKECCGRLSLNIRAGILEESEEK